MPGYYSTKLSGERLRRCYELASPQVKQYLEAEITHVIGHLKSSDSVLELGCGYGRVALRLAEVAARVVGIDTSDESLALARKLVPPGSRCEFLRMDAAALAFPDGEFNAVVCIQNGIGVFGVDPELLVREALRVLRPNGLALFSTYCEDFWPDRLRWFEAQAAAGLVGAIDYARTGNGTIVCRDGLRAGLLSPEAFRRLCGRFGVDPVITTVDNSSVFCKIRQSAAAPAER